VEGEKLCIEGKGKKKILITFRQKNGSLKNLGLSGYLYSYYVYWWFI